MNEGPSCFEEPLFFLYQNVFVFDEVLAQVCACARGVGKTRLWSRNVLDGLPFEPNVQDLAGVKC